MITTGDENTMHMQVVEDKDMFLYDNGYRPAMNDLVEVVNVGPTIDGILGKVVGYGDQSKITLIVAAKTHIFPNGATSVVVPASCLTRL